MGTQLDRMGDEASSIIDRSDLLFIDMVDVIDKENTQRLSKLGIHGYKGEIFCNCL